MMTSGSQGLKLEPGDVLEGRFRLEEKLGEGGFGAVFRATQLNIDRQVAIKVVLPQLLAMSSGLDRFLREAQVAQRLEHPNIVRMYDFGHTEDETPYIAWELLKGQPLDAVLESEEPVSVDRVVRISLQVLKALMEAHAIGIVHRDIKPANIFLSEFSGEPDFVKVLDFGIAKALDVTEHGGKALTMAGQIIGTPTYMAPEQVEGKAVGPSADLYSLGLVMAELLTGHAVFAGTGLAVCAAQLSPEPVPLRPDILSSPIGPVIGRATQKRVEDRYITAQEMLEDLKQVARDLGEDSTIGFSGQMTGPGHSPGPGGVFSSGPTSAPGAVVSPTSQPALLQPTGVGTAGAAGQGSSHLVLFIIGGVTAFVVFALVVIGVVALAMSGDDPDPNQGVTQTIPQNTTPQYGTQQQNNTGTQGYPTHWGTQPTWSGNPANNTGSTSNQYNTANLANVTPELITQRLQGAGWSLMQSPNVQNSGIVSTVIVTAMRNQTAASVMMYDYTMPMALEAVANSLSSQPGALVRNNTRVLYVRVMNSAGGDAESQQLLATILQ